MKKRAFAILMAFCLLITLFAACGNSTSSAASTASAAAESAPTEEAASAAEAAPAAEPAEAPAASAAEADSAEEGSAMEEEAEEAYVYTGEWAEYPLCEPGSETLTMWCEFPGFLNMIGMDSYNNMSVWAAAEAATGVHVEFTEVSMTNASEQFSLMCAANDMKDILAGIGSYYGSTAAAVEDEICIDLAEYAEQYMGNYMTILNDPQYKNDKEKAYNLDGQLVAISSISDDYKPSTGCQIRQDWLDALGLDTPETYDDWETVLMAFKGAYDCTDTLLLSGATQQTNLIAGYATTGAAESNMGNATVNMYQVDGVIRNGYQDESYKDYLIMMNRWYSEGLLSKDFITASSDGSQNGMDGTILSGNSGIWFSQGNFIDQYMEQAQVDNPDYNIAALPDPYSPEYNPEKTTHFTAAGGSNGGSGALSVSTNCENPELACQWMDYFWTEDGQLLCNYGIEGEGFEYDADGNPQFSDMVLNGGNFQFYMTGYTLSGAPTLTDFDKSFFTYSDNVLSAFDVWDECSDDLYTLPQAMSLSTEQSDAYTLKFSDINTMAQEKVDKFITGEEDINAEWDAFQQDLIDMGIQECIDIYQECYDEYIAARGA